MDNKLLHVPVSTCTSVSYDAHEMHALSRPRVRTMCLNVQYALLQRMMFAWGSKAVKSRHMLENSVRVMRRSLRSVYERVFVGWSDYIVAGKINKIAVFRAIDKRCSKIMRLVCMYVCMYVCVSVCIHMYIL
jgi:hypothetical protein